MANRKNSPSMQWGHVALVAVLGVVIGGGAVLAYNNQSGSQQVAAVAASVSADNATLAKSSGIHAITFNGPEKCNENGFGCIEVGMQDTRGSVTVNFSSSKSEINRLKNYTKGAPLAYVSYVIVPNSFQINGVNSPVFQSPNTYGMNVSGTNLVATTSLAFAADLLPGDYSIWIHVHAADSSFELAKSFDLIVDNSGSCSLKG